MRNSPLLALFALGACAAVPTVPVPMMPAPVGAFGQGAACNDSALGSFIGQPASAVLGAQLLGASGARDLRWVPIDGAVTMEFSYQRLTVQLDRENRVASAKCG